MPGGTRTWLVELPLDVCEMLLRTAPVGRLGVVIDGHPEVYPICHVYVDGCIAFPTNLGTKLHAALSWPWVCFEVDGVSPDGQSGWSVMVTGEAEVLDDADDIERAASLRLAPWRTSGDAVWVRIIPETMSGRRIEADTPLMS